MKIEIIGRGKAEEYLIRSTCGTCILHNQTLFAKMSLLQRREMCRKCRENG